MWIKMHTQGVRQVCSSRLW